MYVGFILELSILITVLWYLDVRFCWFFPSVEYFGSTGFAHPSHFAFFLSLRFSWGSNNTIPSNKFLLPSDTVVLSHQASAGTWRRQTENTHDIFATSDLCTTSVEPPSTYHHTPYLTRVKALCSIRVDLNPLMGITVYLAPSYAPPGRLKRELSALPLEVVSSIPSGLWVSF